MHQHICILNNKMQLVDCIFIKEARIITIFGDTQLRTIRTHQSYQNTNYLKVTGYQKLLPTFIRKST